MAAVAPSQRSSRTPARPRLLAPRTEAATEPPNKKRKYIPGGAGGGGRWRDDDGEEHAVGGTGPGGVLYTGPRGRVGKTNSSNLLRPRAEEQEGEEEEEQEEEEKAEGEDTPTAKRPAMQTRPRRERSEKFTVAPATPRPRYSSAAAAAAASQASDGYKPREERSWEDFHPELEIGASMPVFTADEVDGRTKKEPITPSGVKPVINGDVEMKNAEADAAPDPNEIIVTPVKRKPGRPPRRPESMLHGLGSPPAPRIIPLPTHNPKERLNLPKPSFRIFNHFLQYEEDQRENKVNYVDRTMAHVGYQESDRHALPIEVLVRLNESAVAEDEAEVALRLESDGVFEASQAPVVGKVEYDMDEQDVSWLAELNEQRKAEGVDAIKPAIFEITMTQIEKEYHALEKRIPKPQPRHAQMHRPRSSSQAAVNGDPNPPGDEPDSKCSICDDGDCENANAIIFCDGCDLAVHQECYGVPFIPEGQWFCRKCKEIGRGTPTCIFCPNVDGAFKQTNTLRWSHLLCSIWIPEVTIANMTFMEPITDVEKVPKSRWKLHCYICNQKMGACIQCGNKNCYLAFHVTCARKAKLFLKMKSQHQQGLDITALKAFCDKHVPPEWRRMHDTDRAIIDAKRWYKYAFKDRKWADSQTAALQLGAPPQPDGGLAGENMADDTIAVSKRRKNQPPKMSWRLPSGAPVVPAVVFNTVDVNMARFTIRKRKEFVEKICRYWTLKREARRGAALLKRLQLQLESFSSMEITRRNFAGMGAAGRPRLIRRIEFAEMLQQDMTRLTKLSSNVREREELRVKEVEMLKDLVDIVYFPIPALLRPIMQRAKKLDEKTHAFQEGLDRIARLLRERYYTSVVDFSNDLTQVIASRLAAMDNLANPSSVIQDIHTQLNDVKPGTAEHMALTQEQKDMKRLAKRILKAVKEPIEDATRKEAELRGRELEEEMRKLDAMGIFAASKSLEIEGEDDAPKANGKKRSASNVSALAGALPTDSDVEMADADERTDEALIYLNVVGKDDTVPIPNKKNTPASQAASCASSSHGHSNHTRHSSNTNGVQVPTEPLSPPISTEGSSHPQSTTANKADVTDVFANGGVPWYLEPFDPEGTTVHDERWTGREVLDRMSEELSDMDEDTLTELAVNGVGETPKGKGSALGGGDGAGADGQRSAKKPKKKGRRQQWSRPRVR